MDVAGRHPNETLLLIKTAAHVDRQAALPARGPAVWAAPRVPRAWGQKRGLARGWGGSRSTRVLPASESRGGARGLRAARRPLPGWGGGAGVGVLGKTKRWRGQAAPAQGQPRAVLA